VLQLDLCGAVAEVLGDADLRTFASAAEALAALPLLARLDLVLLDAPGPATRPAEAAAHAELARRALERGARLISLGEEGPVPDLRLHLPFTTAMVHRLIGGLISS
jgi:hypothetical protein